MAMRNRFNLDHHLQLPTASHECFPIACNQGSLSGNNFNSFRRHPVAFHAMGVPYVGAAQPSNHCN